AAGLDACTLANNHVLDWGKAGLRDTLHTLAEAGIATCGAGVDANQAAQPAAIDLAAGGRVLVFGFADASSGVPRDWAASAEEPGVNLLPDLSPGTAERVAGKISAERQPGDIVVASIHWGGNWGHEVPTEQARFARRLIDAGISIVHGHSSHHAKALELYGNGLILYGAGDFLNDYEGIGGHEDYRDDLVLMIWPELDGDSGAVGACTLTPLRLRNMRLVQPAESEVRWLAQTLARQSRRFGTNVEKMADGRLAVTG
ncbi:MAG: CapA family protein, partial [Rhodovibrionaceae bacterium]|nr:CapA family protein [Rhodovibrionaceae bacterium]